MNRTGDTTRAGRRRWAAALAGGVGGPAVVLAAMAGGAVPGVAVSPATAAVGSTLSSAVSPVTNLLTGSQGSFDSGTGGWTGAGASLASVATPVLAGAGALAVTATAAGTNTVAAVSGSGPGSWTPAVPGQAYTAAASVRAATVGRRTETVLAFLSATGTGLGSAFGQLSPDSASSWSQATPASGVAPAGTAYVEMAVFFYGTPAGETHYVDSASMTTRSGGSSAVVGPLHTAGNQIVQANGQPVTLRGTVSDWLDWNASVPATSPLSDASVADMKLWGDNVVRVLLSENYWDSNDCLYAPGYAGAVDQVVRSITSRGMVALLSLHNNGRTPCEASNQQRMADSPGSISFWQSVASRYSSNPLVAFDLYNEPHDITWSQWLNGGTLTDGDGVTWQAAGMQQMYQTVRRTGATNLVIVSGNSWADNAPPAGDLVLGTNVVYAAHAYTCPNYAPPTCTYPDPTSVPSFLTAWAPLTATEPVMVTEFGWPDAGGSAYTQAVINWAESVHVGWTAYGWYQGGAYGSGATTPDFGILAGTTGIEPAASGMPVLAGLADNPR